MKFVILNLFQDLKIKKMPKKMSIKTNKNLLIFLFSAAALALIFAYISQFVFNYQPCILCLYQRKPFFAIIALTLSALVFFKTEKSQKTIIFFCIIFLIINAGIAFYHVGVEQKIFKGFSGCSSQNLNEINDLEELKKALLATKAVRCDQPQFFLLSLSMAAWNLIYCITIALFSFLHLQKRVNRG